MPHINKSVSCACLRLLKPRLACRKGTSLGRGRKLKVQGLGVGGPLLAGSVNVCISVNFMHTSLCKRRKMLLHKYIKSEASAFDLC